MADFLLYSDSSTSITLRPEYDFAQGHKKIQSRFRSKSGPEYAYTWADYKFVTFGVEHMTVSDAAQITSWWLSNTELKFQQEGDAPIDVWLVGEEAPIESRSKPYATHYEGVIRLEEF